MENAIVEKTYFCGEIPNMKINASNGAIVKVVFNVVNPAGEKNTVIMGCPGEQEMAGSDMTVVPGSTGFTVAGKASAYTLSGAVDEDEFSSLLYWINKHPALVEALDQKACELGTVLDSILMDAPAATTQENGAQEAAE